MGLQVHRSPASVHSKNVVHVQGTIVDRFFFACFSVCHGQETPLMDERQ